MKTLKQSRLSQTKLSNEQDKLIEIESPIPIRIQDMIEKSQKTIITSEINERDFEFRRQLLMQEFLDKK